jgi:hypothetical protein
MPKKFLEVEYFLDVIKRPPRKENCTCPHCDYQLSSKELSEKSCNACGCTYRTNIHGEPQIVTIRYGEETRSVTGFVLPRKSYLLDILPERKVQDNAICPHCQHELSYLETKRCYCRSCQNSFNLNAAGQPYILVIDPDKEIPIREFKNENHDCD